MSKIEPFDISSRPASLESLAKQVAKMASDLEHILRNLSIRDNFRQEYWEGDIPANSELKIPHRLKVVPSGIFVLEDNTGVVRRGVTPWTIGEIYVENPALLTSAHVKIAIVT